MTESQPVAYEQSIVAYIARCERISAAESRRLAAAWAMLEDDAESSAGVAAGIRLAKEIPIAVEASDRADWAFRGTLAIPGDNALYADLDPILGRAINAIRARALAIGAGGHLAADLSVAMSRPWRVATDD